MKWFVTIAVVIALTSTAAGAQNTPAPTAQQKQDLSNYNFKGAETALEAQSNQPATKQNSLTPIPPLKVPPIVSSAAVAQSPQSTSPTEKGSAVPLNWTPPHADLNAAGISAAEVSSLWETGVAMPTPGPNGKVVYIYGQGMPVLVCAPLRVCAIELEAGEHLQSQPQIGDSRRWEITPVLSGSGLDETPILIIKPIEAGLETDLIVPTDKRTYVVRLVSDPTRFVSRLAFQYPDEDRAKWAAFEARQDESKRNVEALAEERRERDRRDGVVPMADNTVDSLYLDYKLSGDEHLRPDHVFDDGQHTYLIYPNDGRFRELPTLLLVVNGKTELVNFRVDSRGGGSRYIVDRLFDKAILVVGVGKKQTRVTITRETPYSQAGRENGQ
ncbi:MAG: P-type conjugative transfer protein TrbG [Terracidiphilus sp.]|jgi:type IV secretion system protein VirB9